ncbi:hypothetical protein OCB72_30070 [Bacillus cereus]|nr:hypothetical protein [Bacillus cereus]
MRYVDKSGKIGDWIVCETEDMTMISQVKKINESAMRGKVDLWGYWHTSREEAGEWGYNHADRCRYATVSEITAIREEIISIK